MATAASYLPPSGVDASRVYFADAAHYDGSSGTAHYVEITDVTCNGNELTVTLTATGSKVESVGSSVNASVGAGVYPVFIVIPAESIS